MRFRNANYYGYMKESYSDCIDMIRQTDIRHFQMLNRWFMIINLIYALFANFNMFGVKSNRVVFYIVYAGIAACMGLIAHFYKEQSKKHAFLVVYVNIIVLLIYSIQTSMAQPYLTATMYIVLIVVIGVAYIDTMIHMTVIMTAFTAFFLFMSYKQKALSIAYQDTYNALIFLTLALTLHHTFQRTRIQQFITHQKNIQIQRELEIKSSFDALTELLNRGRFFSIAGNVFRSVHNEYMALFIMDLDSFKQINDKLGHQMGDMAIKLAAETIIKTIKIDVSEKWSLAEKTIKNGLSFAGRLGGDEFVVIVRGMSGRDEMTALLEKMISDLNHIEYGELKGIQASIGVTEIEEQDSDIDAAYKQADEALYESKRGGKNRINFSERPENNSVN